MKSQLCSQFIEIPSEETLLSDHQRHIQNELNNSIFLNYSSGNFVIKRERVNTDFERQKQIARDYIVNRTNQLAIYDDNKRFFCKIQPYDLDISQDQDGFFITIRSQQKEILFKTMNNKDFYLSNYRHGRDQSYPNILRGLIGRKRRAQKCPSENIRYLIRNYHRISSKQIKASEKLNFTCSKKHRGYNTSIKQKQAIKLIGQNTLLILSGGAGVGKTKTATVAAIEFLRKYNKKAVLCALTFAASKSLAIHMLQELKQIASYFNDNYKKQILLMKEFQNLIKLFKNGKKEDIYDLEDHIIRKLIRQIDENPKDIDFLFHNGLIQQSFYFQQEQLLRYFSFNSQVLINLIKLNRDQSILRLFINLHKVARKQSTTPQFHRMYKAAVRLTINNINILITNTAKVAQINDLQAQNQRFTPELGILDEARQASLLDTFCLLSLNIKRLILLGDQHQLSIEKNKYYSSLKVNPLEIFDSNQNIPRIILTHNYRMSISIQQFNQFLTYGKDLCSGNQRFTIGKHENSLFKKPIFMVTHSAPEEFVSRHQQHGRYNEGQIERIKDIIKHFKDWNADFGKIAILTFYKGQVEKIESQLGMQMKLGLVVSTIDGFQGGQKDYVIVSCVRSNSEGNLGFADDKRRLNVAFTRPRRGLIIVGNHKTLTCGNQRNRMWKNTMTYLNYNSAIFKSAKEMFEQPPRILQQFQKEFDDLSTQQHFDQEDREQVDRMTPQERRQYFVAQVIEAQQGNGFQETIQLPFIATNQR